MKRILNGCFYVLKWILLFGSFAFTLYIVTFMYKRLEKSMIESIPVFLPYLILFILFSINLVLNQKAVKNDLFYNFTCCFVFALFIYVGYRAVFDSYMVARIPLGYEINFNYYSDMISPLQIMLYGLSASNILLMFTGTKKKEKVESTVKVAK